MRTVVVGTVVWAVALVGLLPFWSALQDAGRTWWIATCGCGIALGVVGVYDCRRRERAIARDTARERDAT